MRLTAEELQAMPDGTRLYTDAHQRDDWYWLRDGDDWMTVWEGHHPKRDRPRRPHEWMSRTEINLVVESCTLDEAEEFIRSAYHEE